MSRQTHIYREVAPHNHLSVKAHRWTNFQRKTLCSQWFCTIRNINSNWCEEDTEIVNGHCKNNLTNGISLWAHHQKFSHWTRGKTDLEMIAVDTWSMRDYGYVICSSKRYYPSRLSHSATPCDLVKTRQEWEISGFLTEIRSINSNQTHIWLKNIRTFFLKKRSKSVTCVSQIDRGKDKLLMIRITIIWHLNLRVYSCSPVVNKVVLTAFFSSL